MGKRPTFKQPYPMKERKLKSVRERSKDSIAIGITKIQKIIRSYIKSLLSTKLENLNKMSNFLDIYYLPKLNQD